MSYYYTYYLGYEDKEGKVYPLGPYDYYKHLCPVLCKSRSFASLLYKNFRPIEKENASKELKKEFSYEFEDDEKDESKYCSIKKLDVDSLPKKSFIKSGYYLIKDVKIYENYLENDNVELPDGIFEEKITPIVYTNMLTNELLLNQGSQIISVVGEDNGEENEDNTDNGMDLLEPQYSAGDYMYYSFPDFASEEYEAHLLREAAESFDRYDGKKLVILLIEG